MAESKYITITQYRIGFKIKVTQNINSGYYLVLLEDEKGHIRKAFSGYVGTNVSIDYDWLSKEFTELLTELKL